MIFIYIYSYRYIYNNQGQIYFNKFIIALHQLVIVFDVKIAPHSNAFRAEGSLVVLHSTASTYLHTNSSDIEVEEIMVRHEKHKQQWTNKMISGKNI